MNENPTDGGQELPGYSLNMSELPPLPDEPNPAPPSPQPPPTIAPTHPSYEIPPAPRPPGAAQSPQHSVAPVYHPAPVEVTKRRLDVVFFILGFFTPWAAGAVLSILGRFMVEAASLALNVLALGTTLGIPVAQLVAWVVGRSNGNNRLRSWGLGGMAAVAFWLLAALLLFGSCLLNAW